MARVAARAGVVVKVPSIDIVEKVVVPKFDDFGVYFGVDGGVADVKPYRLWSSMFLFELKRRGKRKQNETDMLFDLCIR